MRIRNQMKTYNVTIESIKQNENESGGSIFYCLNPGNIHLELIIHPCGEIDLEGDVNTEEMDAIFEDFHKNPEVDKYFPSDSFEIPFEEEPPTEGMTVEEYLNSMLQYMPSKAS